MYDHKRCTYRSHCIYGHLQLQKCNTQILRNKRPKTNAVWQRHRLHCSKCGACYGKAKQEPSQHCQLSSCQWLHIGVQSPTCLSHGRHLRKDDWGNSENIGLYATAEQAYPSDTWSALYLDGWGIVYNQCKALSSGMNGQWRSSHPTFQATTGRSGRSKSGHQPRASWGLTWGPSQMRGLWKSSSGISSARRGVFCPM